MIRKATGILVLLVLSGCGGETSIDLETYDDVLGTISGPGVRAHMDVLAADEMEGREAGTPGYDMAAEYVAEQYRTAGLEPFGDDGTYFQSIEFLESSLIPESAKLSFTKDGNTLHLRLKETFYTVAGFGDAEVTVTAPLVFIGHGISAPELNHDDFADVDVSGRIVVYLSGAPPQFATDQRAYYSSSVTKKTIAVEKGAVGSIAVRTPVDEERRPWTRGLPGVGRPSLRWIEADGSTYQGFTELLVRASLSPAGAEELFELSGHNLDETFEKHAAGETGSFEMGVEATLESSFEQRTIQSPNVAGVLRGSDAKLKDEYVVYTGHLDHIGIRPGKDGDDIHNGFYDNAAGIATILEIAGAMTAMETAPRRSVVFLSVTAEEKGLQGSSYFARNPPVPVQQIVANINIDMPYLAYLATDIEAFGSEHTTLQQVVEDAAAHMDMTVTPDPKPEEVRFVRSDQFSFVKEGIPAIAYKNGSRAADPEVDGTALLDDFLKNHYHQASDDTDLPLSLEAAERFAQMGMLLGLIVANQDDRPVWNEGDFFGERFAK